MRKYLLILLVIGSGISFIGRLFFLQVWDSKINSLENDDAIRKIYQYPKRGYIYDRHDKLLVANQPTYDLMVVPREVGALDTLLFCNLLKIDKANFLKSFERAKRYSPRLPSLFLAHISKKDYAFLSEKMRKFKGFYIRKRSIRDYQTEIGSNVLGYIAEVNPDNLYKDDYYKFGDLIGKLGVEKSYEKELRGIKGVKYIQKDIYNQDIGPYKEQKFDTLPIPGKDIKITIDAELQAYGEKLMKNKIGGIVAIEPNTGELLSLVSAPSYNP
ncbi:MAG: penicillin-binding protein 2, partial [Bacteroidota bacterium]|nr:penicillin-binding protein 2 [Bacteroidota bacterium]